MVTFARNEIVSSSQFVRSFATFLQRMTKSNGEKIVVVKNDGTSTYGMKQGYVYVTMNSSEPYAE